MRQNKFKNVNCNNSTKIETPRTNSFCVGQDVNFNLGFYESDDDSLKFSLVPLKQNSYDTVYYQPNYSGIEPITGMKIDSISGQLTFNPNVIGKFVIGVLAEEFDRMGISKEV